MSQSPLTKTVFAFLLTGAFLLLAVLPATATPRPAIALVHLLLPPENKASAAPAEWVRSLDRARDRMESRGIPTVVSAGLPGDIRTFREVANMEPELLIVSSPRLYEMARETSRLADSTTVLACTDDTVDGDISGFQVRTYEAHYLAGLLAGLLSQKSVIGYLANNPYQSEASRQRNANAFALGVQAANPAVKTLYASGKAPEDELDALLAAGADIVDVEWMRPSLSERLRKQSARYIGTAEHPGDPFFLAAPEWEWGNVFGDILTQVRFGIWRPRNVSYGLQEGVVRLSSFGPSVPDDVREQVRKAEKELRAGGSPFKGPVRDNTGTIRIGDGKIPSDEALRAMNWSVQGLIPLSAVQP